MFLNNANNGAQKTLIFAPSAYSLFEVTNMMTIAEACRADFKIVFISYGGKFEDMIYQAGFEVKQMTPRLTQEKIDHLFAVSRAEKMADYFTAEELSLLVANEVALFKELNPVAVLTGWCLSTAISTRASGVNFIPVIGSTIIPDYFTAGLASWPDMWDFPILRRLPEKFLSSIFAMIMLKSAGGTKPFNQVAKQYGLPPFKRFLSLFETETCFIHEPGNFSNLKNIHPRYHFIGPITAKIGQEIPDEIKSMPKDKPIVYFAMGSSGNPTLIANILAGFEGQPYRVIAPIRYFIEQMNLDVPDNVIVTDFIPAHKVNPLADISVIHGGIGTVINACLSGTPIVGICTQIDHEGNIDSCVRKGFAIRLRRKHITATAVLAAIDTLLKDEQAKKAVKQFQQELMSWDTGTNAARILRDKFGGQPRPAIKMFPQSLSSNSHFADKAVDRANF